ncbi:cation:proton antiporter [Streptomyces sp. NPDC047000]|uniref:cation:proton antiporter n=1 Tax=Streptomyces sp. NPDC047000 TaxID=3155474 RepID=UPI0033C4ECE6
MDMPTLGAAAGTAIPHDQMLVLLLQIGILLALATVLGRLAARSGLPPVVGELTAGIVAGPSVLGHLAPGVSHRLFPADPGQTHLLGAVAQLGALLLVGITGAHIDLRLLRDRRAAVTSVSVGSVLLPLVAGTALGFVLPGELRGEHGGRTTFALFIGVAVAVSALPVIAKTLLDMRLLHRDVGQLIIGAAAVSDIAGWLLLSVVSATATAGFHAGTAVRAVGGLILILVVTMWVARPVTARVLRLVERSENPGGPGVAVVVVLLVLAAAGTHALGMEPILGAFLCGIVIGSAGPAGPLFLNTVRTFVMAVLAPLFLAGAGLQADLSALADPPVLAAALVTLAVAVGAKLAGGYAGARLSGSGHHESLAVGAGLNARGVVEIVLASVGLGIGVLDTASYTVVVLVALVTSVMAPPILRRTTRHVVRTDTETERERRFAGEPVRS